MVGANIGLKSLLMEHGHNMDFSDARVTTVKNWREIYDIVVDSPAR
jgi:hypothetical protein